MQAAGLEYLQHDNCFPYIANWTKAQRLMDRQLKIKWPKLLNGIARQLNPIHGEIFRRHPISYYWSTYQHEWALDVVFHHATYLRQFYPRWVNHAMTTFSSPDVMRFLGKHINSNGQLHQDFSGEVVSDFKRRAEGVRIKHRVNGNSVKLYDKAYTPKGSVLRAEATIHNAHDFRVYRRKEGDRKGPRRVGHHDLKRSFQNGINRFPINARAFHRHMAAAFGEQPGAQAEQLSGSGAEAPYLLLHFPVSPNHQQAGHHRGLMHIQSTSAFHQSLHNASIV
jgi:hypothetical protein